MTELAQEQDTGIGCARRVHERHHGGRTGVADHLQLPDASIGEPHGIEIDIEDATGVLAFVRHEGHHLHPGVGVLKSSAS